MATTLSKLLDQRKKLDEQIRSEKTKLVTHAGEVFIASFGDVFPESTREQTKFIKNLRELWDATEKMNAAVVEPIEDDGSDGVSGTELADLIGESSGAVDPALFAESPSSQVKPNEGHAQNS